jgi:exopolysaccharide biosynthesis predicted pyruvyltransferase EpsI
MENKELDNLDISTPAKLKTVLHERLKNMGVFESCALLDYPDYFNIGDHLIWLGTVFYLTHVRKIKIKYTASCDSFSASEMEKQIGQAPILLQGGGNLGDLWPRYQRFREKIISKYKDNPIIILPQSIYFIEQNNLLETAGIFNSHPHLILFVRDNYSYEIAKQYFSNCQVFKSPDMASNLIDIVDLPLPPNPQHLTLFHCRQDKELNQAFATVQLPNLVVEDWVSYQWISREKIQDSSALYWRIPGLVRLIREVWQRRLGKPQEWLSYHLWYSFYNFSQLFELTFSPTIYQESLRLTHSGIYQFNQYKCVVTNRLHGHILCLLLGKPHIFLPNYYYKNKAYYETWSQGIRWCNFLEDPSRLNAEADKMLRNIKN